MCSPHSPTRSRRRGQHTPRAPMPVMISRSGRCPWRTSRRRPSSVTFNVYELTQPGTFSDPLTEVLRNGARTLLGLAVEAEVAAWLSTHTDKLTDDGRRRLVRHGHLPE